MFPVNNPKPASLDRFKSLVADPKEPLVAVDPRSTGEIVQTKYDSDLDYVENRDYQDIRAARQGSLEAVGNIIGRNVGKFGTRSLDGIAFLAAAPLNMLKQVATGEADSFSTAIGAAVDNPVSVGLRKMEDWFDQTMPVYQTKEQDSSIDVTSMGFLDKVLNGTAYAASMAVGVGGLGKLAKVAGGSKNLGKIFGNAIEEGRDLNYITNLFSNVADIPAELGRISAGKKASNILKENFSDFYGGAIESAAEASQTREETIGKLTQEAVAANGGQPLTKDQEDAIKQQASEGLVANFATNLLTTGVANKLVFHKLLNNKWSDDMVAYNKIVKTGDQYALKEAGAKVGKYKGLFNKVSDSAILKGAVTEGAQELGQYASNDFFVNLYSNPDADSIYKVDNVFKSLANTTENLASKDAMESMLIGGIIGAGFGGVLNRNDDKNKKANTQRLIDNANLTSSSQAITDLARNTKFSDAADGAMLNGDRVTFETLKAAQVFDLVNSRDEIGRFGDIKAELDEAKELPLETFKEKYGIQDDSYSDEKRSQFIDYINDIATKTKDAKTRLMSNYGHKLNELQAENPDIIKFLTALDVHKEDFIKRENELLTKLSPYIKYDEVVANRMTPEKIQDFQQQIENLNQQATTIQSETANSPEALLDRSSRLKKVVNQIATLQNVVANSATEANYKDQLKLGDTFLDEKLEKKPREKTKYAEYTKDLNDLKQIQDTKEQLINYYSKIVNDVDYAKEVQKQINIANQSEVLKNIFSLNLDVKSTPKLDSNQQPVLYNGQAANDYSFATPNAGTQGEIQDYIKTGDIYNLYKKQVKAGTYEDIDTYAPYEVVDTSIDVSSGTPIGKIKVKGQRGETTTYTANQFKSLIRPFVGANNQVKYKYDQQSENVRFYNLFKDRAIKYNLNGKEIVGMLGFSANSYNAEDLVLKYQEDGKFKSTLFKTAKFKGDLQRGYVKILSERETLAFQLNSNAKGYLNSLVKDVERKNKSISTTAKNVADLQKRLETARLNNNELESQTIQRTISTYTKFIDKLENQKAIKQAAAERLTQIQPVEIEKLDELGEDFNKNVDQILEYIQASKDLAQNKDSEGKTPKQIKNEQVAKAFQIELEGETVDIDVLNTELDKLKQSFIDDVVSKVNPEEASTITNPELNANLDLQYISALKYAEEAEANSPLSNFLDSASRIAETQAKVDKFNEDVKERLQQIDNEYTAKLLKDTNLKIEDLQPLKTAQLAAITKFIVFINQRGFFPSNRKYDRKVEETNYSLEQTEDFVTSRPTFTLKTTGNSENADNIHKKEFYAQIHKLSPEQHKVRVIKPTEYKTFGLENQPEDAIFLAVTDFNGKDIETNNRKLVTTLPLNTLKDNYGFRFSDFETEGTLSPVKKEIGEQLQAAITSSTDVFDTLDIESTRLKTEYPKEEQFINDLVNQVTDLQRLREEILSNREANISISINGKSNGVPRLSLNNETSDKALTPTGKVIIPSSGSTYVSGDVSYRITPGRAYFEDTITRTFFPIVTERLGDKTIINKDGKSTGIKYVDNIVNAGKFVQAALVDKAVEFNGKPVTPEEAKTAVNNYLSYITYTNKNTERPESMFEYSIEDDGVVFYIGSSTPLRLESDEALIRELLANKIFNIDSKSLDKDRTFDIYQQDGDNFKRGIWLKDNYQNFIKNNFGIKTNIVANSTGSLYKNGYLILDNKVSIAQPQAVAQEESAPLREPTILEDGPRSPMDLSDEEIASRIQNPWGTTAMPKPVVQNPFRVEGQPVSDIDAIIAESEANNASAADPLFGSKKAGGRVRPKKLTSATYKGDTSIKMTPKQLKQARKKFFNRYGVPFDTVKGLIDNDAYGLVSSYGEVLLSEDAPSGTDYHEEFHVVSQHILDRAQLKDLYSEWRNQNNNQELTDDQVEEELAEAFRLHAQGYSGFKGKIKAIFDYLLNTLKKLVGLNNKLDTLYNDIYRGKYYGSPTYKGTKAYKASVDNSIPYEIRQKSFQGATFQLVNNLIDHFAATSNNTENISLAQRREALGIITTDKDTRLDFLNHVDEEGNSYFQEMINDSLNDYLKVQDNNSKIIESHLRTNPDQLQDFVKAYTAFVGKELNLKGLEESDINEDTTGRDIVKKGDNEIDFFNEAVTQMRLLAYTQSDISGNYPINAGALTKIYIDNLADSNNSQDFEDKLKTLDTNPNVLQNFDKVYSTAIKNINDLIGVNKPTRTKAEQFMIGNLWSSFSKISTDFKILRVDESEEGFGIDYYWVDASKEANFSSSKRDLATTIKDNYTVAKGLIKEGVKNAKGESTVANPDLVFESLFALNANKFKVANPNKIQAIVNAFARSNNSDAYLKNNGNDINTIAEFVTGNNVEKVFSFFNAGGKLQHGLQNPSSLFYRLRDVDKASDVMTMHKTVSINGIQKTLDKDRSNKTSNEITEDDLHILFFNSFIRNNKTGSKSIMPFIFSGDKSTLTGIEVTQQEKLLFSNSIKPTSINGQTEYAIDHSGIYSTYLKDELEDLKKVIALNKEDFRVGNSKTKVKEELPFFSFLANKNEGLYNSIINDVKALKDNIDSIDGVYARYADQVLTETQEHFRTKGKELSALYKNIGFDYSDVLNKADTNLYKGLEEAYLNWYASAYAIGMQEQTKLVGSLNFYDQAAKRLPAWNGTKRALRLDNNWIKWYNNTYNSNIDPQDLRALTIEDVGIQQDIKDEGVYGSNTPSDAQAYISLDAARFMLFSSGTYSYRLDDLFREIETLEKKQTLTEKDLDALNNISTELNEYMNVLKPQYYGIQEVGGLEVPTFYKFSVLPLTKVLTQNRNLDHLRELMARPDGPSIIMFDSANKVGRKYTKGLNLYDDNGNYTFDKVPVETKLDAMQHSSWEGLGIQVDMPKAHETVTFGTQMRKLITVDLDGQYSVAGRSISAKEIRQENDNLILEKLKQDKTDLMNKLGLTEDLTVTPDKIEKVKKELIRQATARDSSNTLIESIRSMNNFDFISNKSKLQQLINSLVSKAVIKQTMTGDAKAMVSSVGFEKKDGGIQYNNRLKFYKKGVQSYMEVLLPFNMIDQYRDHVIYDEVSNTYVFKNNAPEDIRKLIGYRIPTQAPASIENIQIKGFLPAAYGNAVVVPFELTSKAGSDFDIDKLNLFLPKFKYKISNKEIANLLDKLPEEYFFEGMTRLEHYNELQETLNEDLEPEDTVILKYIRDNAKGKYEYAKDHVDNKIIKFYTDLMSSPEYFDNFVNSIDENDFEVLAKEIAAKRGLQKSAKDEKNSANFYDPIYVARRRSSFMNAKDTLGAAAIATTHHAESQKHGLAMNSTILSNGKYARVVKGGKTSATIGDLLSLFQENILENGKVRLDRIYNFENKKISGILSQIVNASVDAAKDDYITSANLDLETVGVASLLVRSGIPMRKIFNFLSQPGVIKYTDELRKTKISALARNKTRDQIGDGYIGNYSDLRSSDFNNLESTISPNTDSLNTKQMNFVDLYKNLAEYADLMTDLQQVSTFDTKATGSMLEENEINLFKYDIFVQNYSRMFSGLDSMFNDETSFTARMREEARNANNFNNSLFKLGELYTDVEGMSDMKAKLDALFAKRLSSGDKAFKAFRFKNYFNSYLLQRIALSNDANFPTVVQRTIPQIKTFTGDNAFIKRLRTGDGKMFMHGGASVTPDEANLLGESFQELYRAPNSRQLAKDILLSGLYQFGLVNNPSTIMNVIPSNLLLETLGITSNDPIIEAYNKVKDLDKSLTRAINNAWAHADANKGSNHFSNYTLLLPDNNKTNYNYANEDPRNC